MKYAKPEWRDGQPYSPEFEDVYFSADNGLEETEHVFIKHNQLLERFALSDAEKQQFIIAETGFGSGLNFLVTAMHWLKISKPDDCLTFYSVENTPFTLDDLIQAHAAWPMLQPVAEELHQQYVVASYGFHYFELFAGRIKLVLMIGDVQEMLAQMQTSVDAWFLDGFAPSLNVAMWQDSVYAQIKRLSRTNTTFSTYTAVGDVRRGLINAGFTVSKVSGCGKKRHMLVGKFELQNETVALSKPWYQGPQAAEYTNETICIIGAGIAALTTAWSLVKRGFQVEIIEQDDKAGAQASGNPQAMLMPRLSLQDSADAEFYTSAYFYALRCLEQLDSGQNCWQQNGGIQLPSSARNKKQIAEYPQTNELARVLDSYAASEISGLKINHAVHYFPLAASLQPLAVLQALIDDMGDALSIRYQTLVDSFSYQQNQWHLYNVKGEIVSQAGVLICATAWQTIRFKPFKHLFSLQPARGQITELKASEVSQRLKLPLSYEGYLLPEKNGLHIAGASFELGDCSVELRDEDHQQNLANMQLWFNELFTRDKINGGRASVRAVTSDRMPIVGAAPKIDSYMQEYADLYKGRPEYKYSAGEYLQGLYVNTGHGARGFSSAFLSAELLAATICDESLPVSNRVRYALHPARFLIRSLKKRVIKKNT